MSRLSDPARSVPGFRAWCTCNVNPPVLLSLKDGDKGKVAVVPGLRAFAKENYEKYIAFILEARPLSRPTPAKEAVISTTNRMMD